MKKTVLLAAVFCLLSSVQEAFSSNLVFRPISSVTSLPTNEIRKLYQDSEGFLWISTYSGLVRYDGYDIVSYKIDPATHRQALHSVVNMVEEDAHHCLWIGTHNGLYVLDKVKGKIEKMDTPILNYSRVESVLSSHTGDIWVATNKGLFVRRNSHDDFEYCVGSQWDLDPTDMKSLLEDEAGYLWIGTWSDGLIRYDTKKRKAYKYSHLPALRSSHTLFMGNDRTLWVGTWGEGLIHLTEPYNLQDPHIVQYKHADCNRNDLLDNIVYSIAEDIEGNLWIGSRSGLSLLAFDGTFSNYSSSSEESTLPCGEINSILSTNDGLMWIGSLGGGVYVCDLQPEMMQTAPYTQQLMDMTGTKAVKAIYDDEAGQCVWLSLASYGIVCYNKQTAQLQTFKKMPILSQYKVLSHVQQIGKVEDDIYFCTEQGIVFYNPKTQQVRHLTNGFRDAYVNDCYVDAQKRFWVATRTDVGLLKDGVYTPINTYVPDEDDMPPAMVYSLQSDKKGQLWIATSNCGIYRLDTHTEKWRLYAYTLDNNKLLTEGALALLVDEKSHIWAGTEAGLMLYNPETDTFDMFSPKQMNSYSDLTVNNLWEDRRQNIWMTTNMGALQMNISKGQDSVKILSYTKTDGLLSDCFYRGAICRLATGDCLLGGVGGVNLIPAMDIQTQAERNELVITDIKIFNRSLRDLLTKENGKITSTTIDYAKDIYLNHRNNNIQIEFALLNFRNSSQNHYAYQLEGWDKDWTYTDAQHRYAFYNNLPAGDYTFHLMAANPNNIWTEQQECFVLHVAPAPWVTWWAYTLYTFLGLLLIYGIYRLVRVRQKQKQDLARSEEDRKRAEEMAHLKLQFFTNITHELLTPLSIIIAAVDELKSKDKEIAEYNLITNNAMRLMRLIQQILEFRKAESGNLKLKVAKGNITQFVENCFVAFQPLARKQKLHWVFTTELEQDLEGYFDSDKLDKILYNLLSNATKYNCENGEVKLVLSSDVEQRSMVLKISDTGMGMDKEELQNLFRRFYDGDYRKAHTVGTGIGLSLVKNLVDLHHGNIFVDSVKGEGTTFTVILPIQQTAYTASEMEDYIADAGNGQVRETSGSPADNNTAHESIQGDENAENKAIQEKARGDEDVPTILIVEDNEDMQFLLQQHLSKQYHTITANSADEALPLLGDHTIQLIVSDIMMPGMNGYEFCSKIKSTFEYCHIPVILITAKQTAADTIMGYESGADAYLTKPIDLGVLDSIVASQLQRMKRTVVDYRKQLVFDAKELNYTSMDEKFLQQAIDCVNKHIADFDFSLNTFVNEMNMSRTTLTDKLKNLTGQTPVAFVNNIRLNMAARIVDEKGKTRVSDLAFAVGFNDPKYFSTLFKKKFGVSPLEYARRRKGEE